MLASVFISTVTYQVMYQLSRYFCQIYFPIFKTWSRSAQSKWLAYILSTINALLSVGYGLYVVSTGWKSFKPHDHDIAAFSMYGYFLHDLIHLLITQGTKIGPAEGFHHVMAIGLLSIYFLFPNLGSYFPMYQLVELSTLFLNLSWHLIKLKKRRYVSL